LVSAVLENASHRCRGDALTKPAHHPACDKNIFHANPLILSNFSRDTFY
jgi:hypothetical protein